MSFLERYSALKSVYGLRGGSARRPSLEEAMEPLEYHKPSYFDTTVMEYWRNMTPRMQNLFILLVVSFLIINFVFFRLAILLARENLAKEWPRPRTSRINPTHLLVVLGSGGHTAEMLSMLRTIPSISDRYTYRTYVVSSGDGFSASKASEFEGQLAKNAEKTGGYQILTVQRARRVHQSLVTAPYTVIRCLLDCVSVLRGTHRDQAFKDPIYPDLILTNGPATGVCVVIASILLLFCGYTGPNTYLKVLSDEADELAYAKAGQMRTVFIESIARVKTSSLSGKILKPLTDRYLVQWPSMLHKQDRMEYQGILVA